MLFSSAGWDHRDSQFLLQPGKVDGDPLAFGLVAKIDAEKELGCAGRSCREFGGQGGLFLRGKSSLPPANQLCRLRQKRKPPFDAGGVADKKQVIVRLRQKSFSRYRFFGGADVKGVDAGKIVGGKPDPL